VYSLPTHYLLITYSLPIHHPPTMNRDEVKKIVRDELILMKKQMDKEIAKDINDMRNELLEVIAGSIDISNRTKSAETTSTEISLVQEETKREIALVREQTKELLVKFGTQITKQTYEKVIGEINQKIVPRMDSLIEYVNYHNQDGQEIITNYRREVDHRVNGQKLLTDGVDDKRVISENVSMFFGNEDY